MNDLISRQAAIEVVKRYLLDCHVEDADWHGDGIEYELKNLPPAQQWIPVSERLPEARQGVIMSLKNWTGEGCYWETTKHHVIWKEYGWNATYWDDEVVAWMPLPEPFKEVE